MHEGRGEYLDSYEGYMGSRVEARFKQYQKAKDLRAKKRIEKRVRLTKELSQKLKLFFYYIEVEKWSIAVSRRKAGILSSAHKRLMKINEKYKSYAGYRGE